MVPRFVADSMVGRLAKWLRAFGFDVVYQPFAEDDELVNWARQREAILVTRDTGLARVPGVRVIFIKDDGLEEQLRQVVREGPLDLSAARPLSRCIVCNEGLLTVTRDKVRDQVPPYVYAKHRWYARCPGCGRTYWQGTHVPRIRERLARLARETGEREQ